MTNWTNVACKSWFVKKWYIEMYGIILLNWLIGIWLWAGGEFACCSVFIWDQYLSAVDWHGVHLNISYFRNPRYFAENVQTGDNTGRAGLQASFRAWIMMTCWYDMVIMHNIVGCYIAIILVEPVRAFLAGPPRPARFDCTWSDGGMFVYNKCAQIQLM